MAQHHKVTFTRGREVVEHGIAYLRALGEQLDAWLDQELPERVRLLMTSVEVEERQLLGAVDRYLEDAGPEIESFAQFTVELPAGLPKVPDAPLSNLSLIQWLQQCHQPLQATFAELGDNADTPEVQEVFQALAGQVEAHERRLSKEYQRFEDL